MLAPDLDVRLVALVEIIARGHGAEGAVVEAQGDGGRVLDVDGLAAHDAGKTRHLPHLQSGHEQRQVQPVDAQPDQVAAAGPRLTQYQALRYDSRLSRAWSAMMWTSTP